MMKLMRNVKYKANEKGLFMFKKVKNREIYRAMLMLHLQYLGMDQTNYKSALVLADSSTQNKTRASELSQNPF